MADYIKREDAISIAESECSACELKCVEENPYFYHPCEVCVRKSEMDSLRNLPAADVVEVVRCKYCAFRVTDENTGVRWCVPYGDIRDDDFFCADGRRREVDG